LNVNLVSACSCILGPVIVVKLGAVECLAFKPDQRILYSCSCDQSIVVWDLKNPNLSTFELHGHE